MSDGDGSPNPICAKCPESCKQPSYVSVIACKRAGFSDWENLPAPSEIGEGHGNVRSLRMPYWLWVGLHFSKPLSTLEIEALEMEFAEVAAARQRQQDRQRDALPPSGEVGGQVKVSCKTLRKVVCPICGQVFEPRSAAHRYCSDQCARQAAKERNRDVQRRRRARPTKVRG